MTFKMICKKIHSSVAEELAAGPSQEQRELIFVAALQEFDRTALEYLRGLFQEEGADSPAYVEARETATQLLVALALPFIRCCSSYQHGISLFQELALRSPDQTLARRCTIYATQLKRRWSDADPSGLSSNPRAREVVGEEPFFVRRTVSLLLLMFPATILLLVHFYQKSPHLGAAVSSPVAQEAPVPPVDRQDDTGRDEREIAPPTPQAVPLPVPDEYYSYTDANGVIRLGNIKGKTPSAGNSTPVTIIGNQVLVPVTLSYRGRSVSATLLLDTGASITTIDDRCAALLRVEPGETENATSIVADGRRVPSSVFIADSIVVGPSRTANVRTTILTGSGGAGHDGLLGMDFLKNFRYHIDFNRKTIEWG